MLRQEINASLVEVQGRRGAVLRERAGRVKGAYRERSERTLDATKRGVPNAYGAVGVESLPQSDAPERRLTWADITVSPKPPSLALLSISAARAWPRARRPAAHPGRNPLFSGGGGDELFRDACR